MLYRTGRRRQSPCGISNGPGGTTRLTSSCSGGQRSSHWRPVESGRPRPTCSGSPTRRRSRTTQAAWARQTLAVILGVHEQSAAAEEGAQADGPQC